jgi:asparaginyl-tRNA synthetase
MKWIYINEMSAHVGETVMLKGWAANKRDSKGLSFVTLRDGTGFCQCVIAEDKVGEEFEATKNLSQETSLSLSGVVVADEKQLGGFELQVEHFDIIHISEDYPITPKEHGVDFLLERRHLWLRSKRQWAIMKVRNATIYAIHNFFQAKDFAMMDSPIFTGSAAEGSTDLFKTDYFGEEAFLAQTGQLYGEAMAMAHGKIYTFGPTFRAEKSKTRRHLTEFWMIEPEMAFYDLDMDMDLIEEMLRAVVNEVINRCTPELQILERDIEALKSVNQKFPRITYDEAIQILRGEKEVNGKNAITTLDEELKATLLEIQSLENDITERELIINDNVSKKGIKNFNRTQVTQLKANLKDLEEDARNMPQWISSAKNFEHGGDLGGSDETVLTKMFGCPIMVYNWPRKIKAFYMKRVEDNIDYVKGVDVLAPEGYGEIVGGSERETDLAFLLEQIEEEELSQEDYEWYLDLRRFGSVPHSGFGLGLERLITWICKLKHIREAAPFPRTSQRLKP